MATSANVPLLNHFAALSGPRQRAEVLYPLPKILLLVWPAPSPGRTTSSRRRCGGRSICRFSNAFLLTHFPQPIPTPKHCHHQT
jgi:hypothetical protein